MPIVGTAEEKLKTFRKAFAERLPSRIAEVESALNLLLEGDWSPDGQKYLHRLVHGLAGSSAIFGYPGVGDAARELEIPLRRRMEEGGEPEEAERVRWRELLGKLKRSTHDSLAARPDTPTERIVRQPTGPTTRGRVLVVEDDEWLGEAVRTSLEAEGFECVVYRDAARALESASGYDPDLFLLDLILPDLDGFEVCRRLRASGFPETPIFFLTSIGQESEMLKAFDAGADDYLTKPFSRPVLTAKIAAAVQRHQRQRIRSLSDFKPGVVVDGRYRIVREIGAGGMGRVYLVEHVEIGSQLALKALQIRTADEEHEEERFRREIRALGELLHPNLIRIHDSGVCGRIRYYTMDYLGGGSLADRLFEGTIPPREALDLAARMADALHFIHQRGILHRDLKPDNILFGADRSEPIVTDFGLVLEIGGDSRLTLSGYVLGTPYYMSPEHVRGDLDIDARSDVYSLGIVLYEMLTGKTPFWTFSPTEVMARIATKDPPRARTVSPDLPGAVDELCAKAIRCDREERFPTAGRFATAARLIAGQLKG